VGATTGIEAPHVRFRTVRIRLLAAATAAATLALAGCGQSDNESRFLAAVHNDAPGMSDTTLLQAGHDFCDHRDDPDGGYGAIDYIGDQGAQLNIGLSADLYLCSP